MNNNKHGFTLFTVPAATPKLPIELGENSIPLFLFQYLKGKVKKWRMISLEGGDTLPQNSYISSQDHKKLHCKGEPYLSIG